MSSIVLPIGFVVALTATVVVYADASQRAVSRRTRRFLVGGVAAVSFGGFLLPELYADDVYPAYLTTVKSAPVVTSPVELLALHLLVGVAVSAGAVLLYGVGSRYGPLAIG